MHDAGRQSRQYQRLKVPEHELALMLRKTAARDRAAFSALYKATSPKLYGIVSRILPHAEASEVLQETFSKIWEAAADFDLAKGSPLAWMATIARNLAIDQVRRARPISLDELSETYEPGADFEDPLAGRERQETYASLLRCLTGLEPRMREMVLFAYYRGASRQALAVKFNIPLGTVKTWLRRSLLGRRPKLCDIQNDADPAS